MLSIKLLREEISREIDELVDIRPQLFVDRDKENIRTKAYRLKNFKIVTNTRKLEVLRKRWARLNEFR